MMRKGEWNRFWRMSLLPVVKQAQRVTAEHWRICLKPLLRGQSLEAAEILELGCGTAKNSFTIFQEYGCRSITLVDYNAHALRIARQRRPEAPVSLVQADVTRLSLRKKFDLVHSSGLVEHFYGDERKKVIARHAEHAKPGGIVMLWAPRPSFLFKFLGAFNRVLLGIREKPFTDGELVGLCKAVGLRVLRIRHKSMHTEVGVLAQRCEPKFAPQMPNGEQVCALSSQATERS